MERKGSLLLSLKLCKSSNIQRIGEDWNGQEWNGGEWSGMEWRGLDWSGKER
jgi:hypothetical protein